MDWPTAAVVIAVVLSVTIVVTTMLSIRKP